jgi:anti-sigma28 factor (negative regulator of flagellin synthesis)
MENEQNHAKRPKAAHASQAGPVSSEIGERLKDLKREIELNRYEVDSHAVADAILLKLRRLRQARTAALGATGRIPPDPCAPPSR